MARMYEHIFDIYDTIHDYNKQHGQSPSYREIANALGIQHKTVGRNLRIMERLYMVKRGGKRRAIQLVSRQPNWNALLPDETNP